MLCNPEQCAAPLGHTLLVMTAIDRKAQLARVDQLIEQFRVAKRRQFMRQAMRLWHRAETDRRLAAIDAPPERVH